MTVRLEKVADRVQAGSLYALLFLLPFSRAVREIAFGVLLVAWLIARLDPATRAGTLWLRPALRPLLSAGAIFLAACVLSLLVSTNPGLSLQGLTRTWLEALVLFMIVTDVGSRPGVAQRSLGVLAASALVVVIEGMCQERYGSGFFRSEHLDAFRRMTGPYEHPIDLATYVMIILPPMSVYALLQQGAARWRVWALNLALILCLARAASISAWFGLGVGVLALIGWRMALRRSALTVLAVALLTAGMSLVSDSGTRDRMARGQTVIRMIADRPILGHGVNTFMENDRHLLNVGEPPPRYAPNSYLQLWAETGVVGLGAFLWWLWGVLGLWRRAVPRLPNGPPRSLLLGLLTGLVAFLAQAALETHFYAMRQAVLFWTLAGLATGLAGSARLNTNP